MNQQEFNIKSFHLYLSIFALITLMNCQQQQETLTEIEKAAIQQEVKDQFDQLLSACEQMNAEAWSEFYSKEEFLSAIGGTLYLTSRTAWVDSITNFFSLRESQRMEPIEVNVTPIAPNLALMTSQEILTMLPKNGEQIDWNHVFTMLWKKEQGGWKILHSHESWSDR